MSSIKDKIKIGYTKLTEFLPENVLNAPFYDRYSEFRNIFKLKLPNLSFDQLYAQPLLDEVNKTVDWWVIPTSKTLCRLSDIKKDDNAGYIKYAGIRDSIVKVVNDAYNSASDNEKAFLSVVLINTNNDNIDEITYSNGDSIVFIGWGMRLKSGSKFTSIITDDVKDHRVYTVSYNLSGNGSLSFTSINRKFGHVLQGPNDIPEIKTSHGCVFKIWRPDAPQGKKVVSDIVYTAVCEMNEKIKIAFDCSEGGTLEGNTTLEKGINEVLLENEIPKPIAQDGYTFKGWSHPIATNTPITSDITYKALFEKVVMQPEPPHPLIHTIRFISDDRGRILGKTDFHIKHGDFFSCDQAPKIEPNIGYAFNGWDKTFENPILEDVTYTANYINVPWYRRFWFWLTGSGCLKKILWLLLFILLVFCILLLFRKCIRHGIYSPTPRPVPVDTTRWGWNDPDPFNPDAPISSIPINPDVPTSPTPINPDVPFRPTPISPDVPGREFLPNNPNLPIPIPNDGVIDDDDNHRRIVADRLNVLLDDEQLTITEFAKDFKTIYPDDSYQIIYADNFIKRLQLKVPIAERIRVKSELIAKLPAKYTEQNVFIWDEALFQAQVIPNDSFIEDCWYLNAINAFPAWDRTMGDSSVVISIVDDGFNINHEDLNGKFYLPYNVYTKSNDVDETPYMHGTHVAGLVAAIANNSTGISGIAPNCKLMPVKVADANGNIATTAIVDGVLYSVYKGADVINISIGMDLQVNIPYDVQLQMSSSYFKEEERLWKKVFDIANKNNVTIVLAAGNENLLSSIDPMHRSRNTIVVAAVDKYNNPVWCKSKFSNYGPCTDVSAPGVKILSTVGDNLYANMDGTSMASPIVAGAVALIKCINRALTTTQICSILKKTGLPVKGNVGNLIQLDKAIELASKTEPDTTVVPIPSTGDVQILLQWDNLNDLDLSCRDPLGQTVSYKNKVVQSGGQLDVDMNAGSAYSFHPIENIFWPTNGAPKGEYVVYLTFYKKNTTIVNTPYRVMVKYGEQTKNFEGIIDSVGQKIIITSFNVN